MSDVIGLEVAALQVHGRRGVGRVEIGVSTPRPLDARPTLHNRIRRLQVDVATMGELVDAALGRAISAVLTRNVAVADAVRRGDADLNALQQRVREGAHCTLITEAPMARDLRAVLAAVQMSSEFERMGDHCVSIARQAEALAGIPPAAEVPGLRELGARCGRQVRDIVAAIVREDAASAAEVAARDDEVDVLYHEVVEAAVADIPRGTAACFRTTTLLMIAHHLERIGDRVTNVAEELVFATTGEHRHLG